LINLESTAVTRQRFSKNSIALRDAGAILPRKPVPPLKSERVVVLLVFRDPLTGGSVYCTDRTQKL
jgi:hypothetical protein